MDTISLSVSFSNTLSHSLSHSLSLFFTYAHTLSYTPSHTHPHTHSLHAHPHKRVTMLAKCPATPPKALGYIATLITNIFEAGGSEGRKTALGSGFLDLVIKLLHTRDPIPVWNEDY